MKAIDTRYMGIHEIPSQRASCPCQQTVRHARSTIKIVLPRDRWSECEFHVPLARTLSIPRSRDLSIPIPIPEISVTDLKRPSAIINLSTLLSDLI